MARRKVILLGIAVGVTALIGAITGITNASAGVSYGLAGASLALVLSIGVPWAFGFEDLGSMKPDEPAVAANEAERIMTTTSTVSDRIK